MNEIEAVTYAESREAFFAGALRKAERQLDWAVKHNPDCYVCAEKGEAVAYYHDALAALRAEEERENGCEYCNDYEDLPEHIINGKPVGKVFDTSITCDENGGWHIELPSGNDIGISICPFCGRRLTEGEKKK